jgi:MFS family permease
VKDTAQHVMAETANTNQPLLKNPTLETTWSHKNLGSVTQAGFVNNLNDAMVWGILPIALLEKGFGMKEIGVITALYPAVWGLSQLVTGKLSDRICKKKLLFWGMLLQGLSILLFLVAESALAYAAIAVVLGVGTAVVYPTFLAAVAENVHPTQRAEALGTFRFWRDFGYVGGAVATGILTDLSGKDTAIAFVGMLTIGSAMIIFKRMYCLGGLESRESLALSLVHKAL